VEVDIRLDATARAELVFECAESSSAANRDRQNVDCSNNFFYLSPIGVRPRLLRGSVEELGDHQHACHDATILARIVQTLPMIVFV
jgi:hypothetical protein